VKNQRLKKKRRRRGEETKGCGARKKMKEKMKGVRRYAKVRQLRVPVFNIYILFRRGGAGPHFFYNQDPQSAPPRSNPSYFDLHPLKKP
jgi:hypothetical protein